VLASIINTQSPSFWQLLNTLSNNHTLLDVVGAIIACSVFLFQVTKIWGQVASSALMAF
jgi:hypothetical protein